MLVVQVYCKKHSSNECKDGQRFCLVCKTQFCQRHFGADQSLCLNCIKRLMDIRLMDIEIITINALNSLNRISSGLPERLYPKSLIEEIRKYLEILREELKS